MALKLYDCLLRWRPRERELDDRWDTIEAPSKAAAKAIAKARADAMDYAGDGSCRSVTAHTPEPEGEWI